MANETVYTFAKWRIREGQRDAVLNLLADLAAKSRAEKGNLLYEVHQSTSDANTLVLYERYRDEGALTEHRGSEHYQTLIIGKIIPLLEDREIILATQLSMPG